MACRICRPQLPTQNQLKTTWRRSRSRTLERTPTTSCTPSKSLRTMIQNPVCRRSGPKVYALNFSDDEFNLAHWRRCGFDDVFQLPELFWRVRDCAERYARFGVDLRD